MGHQDVNYKKLKEFAFEEGISLFGVGDVKNLSCHPSIRDIAKDLPYGISIGYRLSDEVLSTIQDSPSLIYKHHYKTVNWLLDQTAEKIANIIQKEGRHSIAIPASQTVDWERQEGSLDHRIVAQRAGLGWIGKSGLLVNPEFGARVRYATVLTDLPLSVDSPINDGCGDCIKCIENCPARAITENGYNKELCLNKLKEFARIKGIGVYICGVCVKVCTGKKSTV